MCGIAGIYQYRSGDPVLEESLCGMMGSIRHRGPDSEGTYLGPTIALGSRRLSIIDLPGGTQPIYNEDRTVVVVFNGEIYNYRELAKQLRERGHILGSASDTEVIVHLYEEAGDDCIKLLRGMFAFAIWDSRRQRLLVARDRLGIKPLYYANTGQRLVFGSEIKCLFHDPHVKAEPCLDALNKFLSLKYVPCPDTMFEGIAALPPGHILTCDSNGLKVRPYWDLSFSNGQNGHFTEQEYEEQLALLLRDCVQSQLVSDVPFGAFLSGGLDSSIVVALMSQCLAKPVKTFSVGYDGVGTSVSELSYARIAAQHCGTEHHEVIVCARDFTDLAAKVIWHFDQPIADEAAVPNYRLAQAASREVKMVLTGEGGDELFAGYARYSGERLSSYFGLIPQPLKSFALAATAQLPGLRRPTTAVAAWCEPEEISRFLKWSPLFPSETKSKLISEELKRHCTGAPENVYTRQLAFHNIPHKLNRMLYLDTKFHLADALLARGDKASMAASLEARVPLLDHRLVEFAAALPPALKLKGFVRKYLLRQVARRFLPRTIIERKKKGFPTPMGLWFRNEARCFLRDILSPSTIKQRGLFNPAFVQQLLDEHDRNRADHANLLWALINVELWYRIFIDQNVSRTAA